MPDPKPSDFPIGSIESRAAARAMIERRKNDGITVIIELIGHPKRDCLGRWCSGTCGLLTGELVVREDGKVVERIRGGEINHGHA